LPDTQRKALQKRLKANDRKVVWAMIGEALASQADTAITPAQDLLELESKARMNFPGTTKGNWRWRLEEDSLTQDLARRLRSITTTYKRLGSGEHRSTPRCQENDPAPQIAKRAYELYERRGRQNGQTVQDWLQAEQEMKMEANR
jgi:4-alpha-glucanotransferase